MGFIRFILIVVLVYYVLKFLVRWLFPLWITRMANKMQDRMNNQQYQQREYQQKQEGKITIDKSNIEKSTPQEKKDDVGEYIDFEEIE